MSMGGPSRLPLVLPPPRLSNGSHLGSTGDSQVGRFSDTILAPYYQPFPAPEEQRTNEHHEPMDMSADAALIPNHPARLEHQVGQLRGTKRKAEDEEKLIARSLSKPDVTRSPMPSIVACVVECICKRLYEQLGRYSQHDTIQECGKAVLSILEDNPTVALDLAYQKLYTWPYHEVPLCWRRLYEDASLYKALQILTHELRRAKNGNLPSTDEEGTNCFLGSVVRTLDLGITLTGAPLRSSLFEEIFKELGATMPVPNDQDTMPFPIKPLKLSEMSHSILRHDGAMDFVDFQQHLDDHTTPLIISDALSDWPALELWQRPSYLLQHTLNGYRLVPVEIGKSYTDDDWTQKMMSIREFMDRYLLPNDPHEIAYLAQHDLFKQIPSMRSDISIPDFCYTIPPAPDVDASKTAGLSGVAKLEAPLLNVWLGPTGTKTPLHTDPYHNILAQVVGYKYIRLYPPSETSKVYSRGVDEKGISMENTSSVDIQLIRPDLYKTEAESTELVTNQREAWEETMQEFPLLRDARYFEAVLGPGECLYIPLGWWHYAESVSTSFSVSFWWN